jgi:hypothetical protein
MRGVQRSPVTRMPPDWRGWRNPRSIRQSDKEAAREVETAVQSKSREEILEHLRVVLSDQFELEPGQIVPDANLYTDLDLDSIDAVDLFLTSRKSPAGRFSRRHSRMSARSTTSSMRSRR